MLRLDIAWLMGAAWLARGPDSDLPDWPPQPDRIFSALVASWGAGGERAEERAALEWLEAQAPPTLFDAAEPDHRPAPDVFVPPNDAPISDISILPDRRRRQPRRFPAVTLDADADRHLSLVWADEPKPETFAALNDLARRTSHVGHSASVARLRFVLAAEADAPGERQAARYAPYPGRLAELEALHARHLEGDERARPRPAQRVRAPAAPPAATEGFAAAPEGWIVFEHAGGERPELTAAAVVCDALRKALMEAWSAALGGAAPGWLAGHEDDRSPARQAHLAVVPMANVGFPQSDGRLMGLAIVLPKAVLADWAQPGPAGFAARQDFRAALAALGEAGDEGDDGRVLTLAPPGGGRWRWRLRPSAGGLKSLQPARYLGPSRLWASVTPVLLDRHLKAEGEEGVEEAAAIVAEACRRIGLPAPVGIDFGKYAWISGAPPAWPPGGAPAWLNWSRKRSFGARRLIHVALRFPEPVAGPAFIGAGRFVGLGLCLPAFDRGGER